MSELNRRLGILLPHCEDFPLGAGMQPLGGDILVDMCVLHDTIPGELEEEKQERREGGEG